MMISADNIKCLSVSLIAIALVCQGCSRDSDQKVPSTKETINQDTASKDEIKIETAGGMGLARTEIEGFEQLDLDTKKLVYHYYEAALKVDELHASAQDPAERLREKVFRGFLQIENEIPDSLKKKILPYIKRSLVEKGAIQRPSFIPGEFAAVAQIAIKRGVDLGQGNLEGVPLGASQLERLEALLQVVRPTIFEEDSSDSKDAGQDADASQEKKTQPSQHKLDLESDYAKGLLAAVDPLAVRYIDQTKNGEESLGAMVVLRSSSMLDLASKLKSTSVAYQLVAVTSNVNAVFDGDAILAGARNYSCDDGEETYYLFNVQKAIIENIGEPMASEFGSDDDVKKRRVACLAEVSKAHFLLTRIADSAPAKTAEKFGNLYPVLEEIRSNLTALNAAFDPKLQELKILDPECAKALCDGFVSGAIEQIIWMDSSSLAGDPVRQARRVIFKRLVDKGVAQLVQKDGHYYAGVVDYDKMQLAVKELLDETVRILTTGDMKALGILFAGRLAPIDKVLMSDVKRRYEALGLPRQFTVLEPTLKAVRDDDANIIDVIVTKAGPLAEHLQQPLPVF